jgi:hypothetical protein
MMQNFKSPVVVLTSAAFNSALQSVSTMSMFVLDERTDFEGLWVYIRCVGLSVLYLRCFYLLFATN